MSFGNIQFLVQSFIILRKNYTQNSNSTKFKFFEAGIVKIKSMKIYARKKLCPKADKIF